MLEKLFDSLVDDNASEKAIDILYESQEIEANEKKSEDDIEELELENELEEVDFPENEPTKPKTEKQVESASGIYQCNYCHKVFESENAKCPRCENDSVKLIYTKTAEGKVPTDYSDEEQVIKDLTEDEDGNSAKRPTVPQVKFVTGGGTAYFSDCPHCGKTNWLGADQSTSGLAVCKNCLKGFMIGDEIEHKDYKRPTESKVSEDAEDFTVISKGISDENLANKIASEKSGIVVKDDTDDSKFMVIVKND